MLKQEHYKKAHGGFDFQVKTFPGGKLVADGNFMAAESLFKQNKFEEALAAYQRVVAKMPAAKDFQSVRSHIHRILEKASAEIQASDRWDERKLAYDLKGVKRGTYILTYFLCAPEGLADLNQQLQLSEVVVRHLIQQREKPIEPPRRADEEIETREPAEARS